jgi:putative endonuclease
MKTYHVYILSSKSGILYTGVTGNLLRTIDQHKRKSIPGFTARYNISRLVYYEGTSQILSAIAREKEIKGWTRAKKIALIESINLTWDDLSANWYDSL